MANFRNLAYTLVRIPPSPPTSGTTLVLETGHGARLPAVPFTATIWPVTAMPDPTNAEIVLVTAVVADTVTLVRAQEGSTARAIVAEDQLAGALTTAFLVGIPYKSDPSVHWTGDQIVDGDVSVGDDLTVADAIQAGGAVNATGNIVTAAQLGGATLQVSGAGTVGGNLAVGGNLTVTGAMQNVLLTGPILKSYEETLQPVALTGATLPIDYTAGNHVKVTVTSSITAITITGIPTTQNMIYPVMVYYVADGTAGRTVTHTINGTPVRFANGVAPTMSAVAGKIDRILYTLLNHAGALTWLGDIIGVTH